MSSGTEELELSNVAIAVFGKDVSVETIEKYEKDVVANGGVIKDRYYKEGGLNGFSAYIQYFSTFQTFRADEVKYIECDSIVHTQ